MVKRSKALHSHLALQATGPETGDILTIENVCARTQEAIATQPGYPVGRFRGRGIVICGGGRYFESACVLIHMLRRQRCALPVELWYLGEAEMSEEMRRLAETEGVRCVDAFRVREEHPMRILNGWESKSYAILHSSFEEVLFLDADNMPVIDPTFLFDSPEYRQYGAIFWPDIYRQRGQTSLQPALWEALGNSSPLGVPEFESAQILIDKAKCWRALSLAVWLNAHSDFFYQYMYGDKETFHLAWATTRSPYGMPSTPIEHYHGCLCQHDFQGRRVFQHRHGAKFCLHGNVPIQGFQLESHCLIYLDWLARRWDGRIGNVSKLDFLSYAPPLIQEAVAGLLARPHHYTRVGYDSRQIEFLRNGTIGDGRMWYESFWALEPGEKGARLLISAPDKLTCELILHPDGVWRGCWEHGGGMLVELSPIASQ